MLNLSLLKGATDSNWAGDTATRKPVGGYVFTYNGTPVSWSSKQQSVVALSTLQAEYIACSGATREAIWLKSLLDDIASLPRVKVSDLLSKEAGEKKDPVKSTTTLPIQRLKPP